MIPFHLAPQPGRHRKDDHANRQPVPYKLRNDDPIVSVNALMTTIGNALADDEDQREKRAYDVGGYDEDGNHLTLDSIEWLQDEVRRQHVLLSKLATDVETLTEQRDNAVVRNHELADQVAALGARNHDLVCQVESAAAANLAIDHVKSFMQTAAYQAVAATTYWFDRELRLCVTAHVPTEPAPTLERDRVQADGFAHHPYDFPAAKAKRMARRGLIDGV